MKPLSLLLCLALLTPVWGQELPDAPKVSNAQTGFDSRRDSRKIVFESDGSSQASNQSGLRITHHNWFYRHPILTGSIIGGGIALGWGLTHRNSCPHYINGYGYDGTPPCPTSCDGPGDCYWGPKK